MFASSIISTLLLATAVSVQAAPIRRAADPNDILVLQFAGVLERLETEFYTQALSKFQDSDFTSAGFGNVNVPKEIFSNILSDETTHSSIIESTLVSLGAQPVTTCQFNFGDALKDVATMAATARVVENVGVSAYLGGANLLVNKEILIAAATILTVEARHQSILNVLNVGTSIPSAFDISLSPSQVLAIAGGFISGCDLGIPATPALSITNTGAVTAGTQLSFSSSALPSNTAGLTCQMMTGGAPFALSLPIENCVVPENINGPVYIYIVNGTQPLLNSQTNQFATSIVAGPTLAFIDSVPETLGQVAKAASPSVESSSTISASEAGSLVAQAGPAAVQAGPEALQSISASSTVAVASGTAPAASASTFTGLAANGEVSVLGWSTSSGTSAPASSA